jgi:uncharacterized protein (TIGR04255 family)
MAADEAYPRFSSARERFGRGWDTFRDFVGQNNLGPIKLNQYELTYINHISKESIAFPKNTSDYTYVFNWPQARKDSFLPDPSSLALDMKFGLPDKKGRLHVSLKHGRRLSDNAEVLILELTARGPALNDGSDMTDWFSLAHEWIVRGFTDLTTAKSHQSWGRLV